MKLIKLSSDIDKKDILKHIGVAKEGISFLKDKMQMNFIYIKDIKNPAALILKQDALSIGADLAVHRDTILCKHKVSDALLICSDKELKILATKELMQPFGLRDIGKILMQFLSKDQRKTVDVMGVINANDDSFFSGSRYKDKEAVLKIESLIKEGATIIDIGAISSRPGSEAVDEKIEFKRLKPIIDEIYKRNLFEKVKFSLDSYSILCLKYALDKGFSIVNDITGLQDDEVAKITAQYNATVVIMHMKGTPKDMQKDPNYGNVLLEVDDFFEKRIEKAQNFGIDKIILDVGIGFGKKLEHNLLLIKHLNHFNRFGYPLLIGASRKSLIDMITPTVIKQRLPGTLALHLKAVENGATIIRCHDVKEHIQALKVQASLDKEIL